MRVFNFAAGPATLPLAVLQKAQSEFLEKGATGMSVMEMSHRSSMYEEIIGSARDSLRRLMNIPDNYTILFLQGGASTQFAMIPMNLMKTGKADYVVTGSFAKKAAAEAKKYGKVNVVASSEDRKFAYIPRLSADMFDPEADYVHITTNNTIYGTSYRRNLPDVGGNILVADMSSNILSEEMDVSKFGLIYAGAQKNIGPAGVTIVIIRNDLIGEPIADFVPSMLRYDLAAKNDSMYNTPPTYGIYMAGLVFSHLEETGGVAACEQRNLAKAKVLYDVLDASSFYVPVADKDSRSIMNVTFAAPTEELNAKFVKEAAAHGIVNIKGHRSAGGMRASIYNAMSMEGVEALAQFMQKFEKENA